MKVRLWFIKYSEFRYWPDRSLFTNLRLKIAALNQDRLK